MVRVDELDSEPALVVMTQLSSSSLAIGVSEVRVTDCNCAVPVFRGEEAEAFNCTTETRVDGLEQGEDVKSKLLDASLGGGRDLIPFGRHFIAWPASSCPACPLPSPSSPDCVIQSRSSLTQPDSEEVLDRNSSIPNGVEYASKLSSRPRLDAVKRTS